VIPVLEEGHLKPRHWHTHVRTREEAEEYLNRERVQLVWPTPESVAETEAEDVADAEDPAEEPAADPEPPESLEETYDPAEHNVDAVLEYLDEHPEQRDAVLAMERAGRGRKGLLGED
jgi:hypothetical protein